jgi:UDP-glucuronate 4-epimerase
LDEIAKHSKFSSFEFIKADISDRALMEQLFTDNAFDVVVNLAAQAGVRYSLENPHAYVESNLVGFVNILEGCRHSKVKHLVYASSSSVYGMNVKQPFSTEDRVDYPVSLYAATKKSNELMAHSYSHLYNIPTTGLRFFTVYGPFGRPDMAYYKFTKAILNGDPIDVYNNGIMKRDFTYIDDIVEGVVRVMDKTPKLETNDISNGPAAHHILNIGNNDPVKLKDFVGAIERACGKNAVVNNLPMQPGDVKETYADIDQLFDLIGFKPSTDINDGIKKFVDWFVKYEELRQSEDKTD